MRAFTGARYAGTNHYSHCVMPEASSTMRALSSCTDLRHITNKDRYQINERPTSSRIVELTSGISTTSALACSHH